MAGTAPRIAVRTGFDGARLPCRCKPRSDRPGGGAATFVNEDDSSERGVERALRCHICRWPITVERNRVSRSGKHLHTLFNPAGIVYEIGCFSSAPGCGGYGPVSREFSWFDGYRWQIAFCKGCGEHLGWLFSGGDDRFFGLIVNRLID